MMGEGTEIDGVQFSWSEAVSSRNGCTHQAKVTFEDISGELRIFANEAPNNRVHWGWLLEIAGSRNTPSSDQLSDPGVDPGPFIQRAMRAAADHCKKVLQEREDAYRKSSARHEFHAARAAEVQKALEEMD